MSITELSVITRRDFVAGASSLSIAAALATFGGGLPAAFAQTVNNKDLLEAGPLGDNVQGKDDAPVTIVEYASMTCSHCAAFHNRTYPELKKRYIDTGKVRFIMREFPLDPLSAGAFMLARCSGKDRYFAMVETLFRQQNDWAVPQPIPPLFAIARQAGFTQQTFDSCLRDDNMLKGIEAVRNRGTEKFGVNSTPTFFINGTVYRGVLSIEDVAKAVDPLIKS